jgi:hypothetical protein
MNKLIERIQEAKVLSSKLNELMVEISLLSSLETETVSEDLKKEPLNSFEPGKYEYFEDPNESVIENILNSNDTELQESIAKVKELAAKYAEKMKPKSEAQKAVDVLLDEVMTKTPEGEVITKEEAEYLKKIAEFQKEESAALKKAQEEIRLKREKSKAAFEEHNRKIKFSATFDDTSEKDDKINSQDSEKESEPPSEEDVKALEELKEMGVSDPFARGVITLPKDGKETELL